VVIVSDGSGDRIRMPSRGSAKTAADPLLMAGHPDDCSQTAAISEGSAKTASLATASVMTTAAMAKLVIRAFDPTTSVSESLTASVIRVP
jgi:hypothetical protein